MSLLNPQRAFLLPIISAIVLCCAFVCAELYPWISIITTGTFLLPLFFTSDLLTARCGLWWGMIVFGVHCLWVLLLLDDMGFGVMGYGMFAALIAWLSFATCVWFVALPQYPVISTVIFFLFIQHYCLLCIGRAEGYPLFNPLLVLTDTILVVLPFGSVAYLWYQIMIVGCQWLVCRLQKKWKGSVMVYIGLLAVVAWTVSTGKTARETVVMQDNCVGVITPWWHKSSDPMFVAYRMAHAITKMHEQHPHLKVILLPESSFAWNVYEYQQMWSVWSDSAPEVTVIFGGYDKNTHNCLFFLHNKYLLQKHPKQHLTPVENFWPRVVHDEEPECLQSDVCMIGDTAYQFFICSELFFEQKKITQKQIILVWNDSWLYFDWVKHVARLYLQYFALKHDVVVYHLSTLGHHNFAACS